MKLNTPEGPEYLRRILYKSGERNIKDHSIPHKSIKYIKDLANTLVEAPWTTTLMLFVSTYFLSWTFFAILWYLIAWAHGDMTYDPITGEVLNDGHDKCLTGGDNFHGVFMLSMESQVSTGYGEHYPNEECPEAIFLLIIQLICGVLLDGCMIGVIYQKMIRQTKHTKAARFSKRAVICLRDGQMCLIFRVVDNRHHHGIRTKVKAFIFKEKITQEGEHLGECQQRLELETNGKLFLLWPETVCHFINEDSPFYNLSAQDLLEKHFEICVSITGDSRATGQTIQAKTSYLSGEIMWGHRFLNLIHYDDNRHQYEADYEKFDETIPVDTPLCSVKRMNEIVRELQYNSQLEALRDYTIKTQDEEEDEDAEDDDNQVEDENDDPDGEMANYSGEGDLDIVEDMKDTGLLMNKMITRTTSVVQNYCSQDMALSSGSTFTYSTKSLTHIERERELANAQKSKLRKHPRHDMKYYKSAGGVNPE